MGSHHDWWGGSHHNPENCNGINTGNTSRPYAGFLGKTYLISGDGTFPYIPADTTKLHRLVDKVNESSPQGDVGAAIQPSMSPNVVVEGNLTYLETNVFSAMDSNINANFIPIGIEAAVRVHFASVKLPLLLLGCSLGFLLTNRRRLAHHAYGQSFHCTMQVDDNHIVTAMGRPHEDLVPELDESCCNDEAWHSPVEVICCPFRTMYDMMHHMLSTYSLLITCATLTYAMEDDQAALAAQAAHGAAGDLGVYVFRGHAWLWSTTCRS